MPAGNKISSDRRAGTMKGAKCAKCHVANEDFTLYQDFKFFCVVGVAFGYDLCINSSAVEAARGNTEMQATPPPEGWKQKT